ncbi:unnamed protein product [Leptosia nina]|uniref:Uncharacterized protein n=1 Tax=Leptosia nina TaxID=320188 RepID=A0AAV1JP96_9NEOP
MVINKANIAGIKHEARFERAVMNYTLAGYQIAGACATFAVASRGLWTSFRGADVRVYMRRGQFQDKPDLIGNKRRMGNDVDNFLHNLTGDYQDEYVNRDEPLSQKWSKVQDNRNYAEKLTKYSENKRKESTIKQEKPNHYKFTAAPTRHIAMIPNPIFSTTVWQSGSSQIIMRHFEPITEIRVDNIYDDNLKKDSVDNVDEIVRPTQSISPDIRIIVEDSPKSNEIKMRDWKPSPRPVIPDYLTEVDEDAIVYKAV